MGTKTHRHGYRIPSLFDDHMNVQRTSIKNIKPHDDTKGFMILRRNHGDMGNLLNQIPLQKGLVKDCGEANRLSENNLLLLGPRSRITNFLESWLVTGSFINALSTLSSWSYRCCSEV